MPFRHCLAAGLVAVIWGFNFIAVHASLEHFPPFLLVLLRWVCVAVPTVLFVPRPTAPLQHLIGYGVGFGTLQFLFFYWGMAAGMPTGLTSLVLQASAPFTVLLGVVFFREPLTVARALGVALAGAGLVLVASQRAAATGVLPFALVLAGALGWAFGNLASRAARPAEPMRFILWASVVPILPMALVSGVAEGPQVIGTAISTAGQAPWALAGLAYTCVAATAIGGALWSWLLARHPAGAVAPWSMLAPVTGLAAAVALLGERPSALEWVGCAVVVVGVITASTSPRSPRAWLRGSPAAPLRAPLPG